MLVHFFLETSVYQEQPSKIVEALSWFMSLSGPMVLAFDQLDPIVTQLHYRKQGDQLPKSKRPPRRSS